MGLHTGTPLLTEEGYAGTDVHRAARIAAAGHGGQVLVSMATATLVDRGGLRDLGEHRLKDLGAPERIFQLGEREFPPLRTLDATNLPLAAGRLLGREREMAELVELLGDAAPGHDHWARRDRQDPAGSPGRGRAGGLGLGRCLLGSSRRTRATPSS